jgi:hypothetical protein
MNSTIENFKFGMAGLDAAEVFRERYADDRFTLSQNDDYIEVGYLKIALKHIATGRLLIASFDAEAGPAWRPSVVSKNTLIPTADVRTFVVWFADTLMSPLQREEETTTYIVSDT